MDEFLKDLAVAVISSLVTSRKAGKHSKRS